MTKKRICIDLDGVICKLKGKHEGYANLQPIPGAVEKIIKLKEEGHYIIIYTARRMKTHSANVGRTIADIGKTTMDWLADHKIPYDELFFGKPWADVYIDDNALRFTSWSKISDNGDNLPISNEIESMGEAK
jgi:capsule biosynthesis phosphatase